MIRFDQTDGDKPNLIKRWGNAYLGFRHFKLPVRIHFLHGKLLNVILQGARIVFSLSEECSVKKSRHDLLLKYKKGTEVPKKPQPGSALLHFYRQYKVVLKFLPIHSWNCKMAAFEFRF